MSKNLTDYKMDENLRECLTQRLEGIEQETKGQDYIIVFAEIKVTKEQINKIHSKVIGLDDKDEAFEYWQHKLNGSIVLSGTALTTREDVDSFQYIFDEGIEKINSED